MTRNASRLLRLLGLGALVAACLSLAWAGGASAALSFDRATDRDISIDGDSHSFPGDYKPVSYGGYQYFATWDAVDPRDGKVYLQLMRRRLSDGNLVSLRFDGSVGTAYDLEVPNDGHNYVGLGISPNDGRLHISWSVHLKRDRRHRYLQSSSGCMSLRQEEFNLTNCRFEFRWAQVAEEAAEEEMTYPAYFNDSRGRLYFSWRYDENSHGDQYLNSYNDERNTWTARGIVIRGRIDGVIENNFRYDPDGPGPEGTVTSRERGVYISEWKFDKNDRLHALWTWRETLRELVGAHGLNYIYSDDYGRTWYYENTGRTAQIGTAGSDAVNINDLSNIRVVEVPPGYFLGSSGFELDSDNNPHIVLGTSDVHTADRVHSNQLQQHFWRHNDGSWRSQFIEQSAEGVPGLTLMPGEIMLDQANTAYVIFVRNPIEWAPYNAGLYVQAELPYRNVTWQSREGVNYLDVQLYSRTTCLDTTSLVNTAVSTSGNNQIRIRMRNDTDATGLTIWWTNETQTRWEATHLQTFTRELTARDRNYTEYVFRMTDAQWGGTLREIEICTADGVSTGSQRIDSIKITDSAGRAAKTWGFDRGVTLYGAQASSADDWRRWEIEELLPGVALSTEDGYFYTDATRYADEKVVNFNILQQGAPGTEALSLREFDILNDDIIKDWRFDYDAVGWTGINHIERFRWALDEERKTVGGTIIGNDSAMISLTNLKVPIKRNRMIHVVMKNTSEARTARVWFRTERSRTWTAEKSKSFTITPNSGYETYNIDMSRSEVRGWTEETLYQLELDPADDATARGSFKVDRIYINDSTP